jgi:hypothetical protein
VERRRVTMDSERKMLIQMILSTDFLRGILPVLDYRYLKSSYSRTVASWITEYYEEYQEAPKKQITEIYFAKKKFIEDEDELGLISQFLNSLSEQSVLQNVDYSLSQSIAYLKQCSLEFLVSSLQEHLNSNQLPEAEQLIANYSRVEQVKVKGVNVLQDTQSVYESFNFESDQLFKLPGVLGDVIGPFSRGDFAAFLAFAKRGKSYALNYVQECALTYGLSVVTFSLEMTEKQNLRRQWMSFTGRPRYTQQVRIPYFERCMKDDKDWEVKYFHENREGFPKDIDSLKKVQAEIAKLYRTGTARLVSLPSRSATAQDIEMHLSNMEYYDGMYPDVVIIDYADLLDSKKKGEYRHQIDDIWANLRRIALDRNICIVSASQSNRMSAATDLSEESVAEDIRKIAHVTRMVGINQSKKDKENQLYRFHVLADREGLSSFDEVMVLSCLNAGRMVVDSRLVKDVLYEKEKPKNNTRKSYT